MFGLFSSDLATKFCFGIYFSPSMYATCPTHLIVSNLITLILLAEEYKL